MLFLYNKNHHNHNKNKGNQRFQVYLLHLEPVRFGEVIDRTKVWMINDLSLVHLDALLHLLLNPRLY